ncbi:hypothetical protein [Clostridium brassicae]|uniref:Uncharacterized protein n=1 Tax=Clostridium brassicae TaxID=2999072 RepID=A0ABT4D9A6_9CLOT|nr:hypothetical protein [Clostridium brassicae]MCY6958897.1 hypothetical protein [Clostridium brassicae]
MGENPIYTFTKDMIKHTIKLDERYNEVMSVDGGFIILNVGSIDLEYSKSKITNKEKVAISIRNHLGELIAKDFIFDFKDSKLVFYDSNYFYTFKIIEGEN